MSKDKCDLQSARNFCWFVRAKTRVDECKIPYARCKESYMYVQPQHDAPRAVPFSGESEPFKEVLITTVVR